MTQEEFKICFDKWFDEIRNFVYYRCGDADQATDIAQEAFLSLWEKGFDYWPGQTRSLLYKIAGELHISKYRKQQTAKKYELSLSFNQENSGTENHLEYEELKQKYEQALTDMPEPNRLVFLMSRIDELTYNEIADSLKISVKTVEKRMHASLQMLRKILAYGK